MKRMKLVCPNNPEHHLFEANAAVVQTCLFDEHGDFLKVEEVLGLTEMKSQEEENNVSMPGPGSEWICNECEDQAIVEMTGLDLEDLEEPEALVPGPPKTEEKAKGRAKRPIGVGKMGAMALVSMIIRFRQAKVPIRLRSFSTVRTGVADLVRFGLAEKGSVGRSGNRGWYKPTDLGIRYANGEAEVKEKMVVQGDEILSTSVKTAGIRSYLSDRMFKAALKYMRGKGDGYGWALLVNKETDGKVAPPTRDMWNLQLKKGVKAYKRLVKESKKCPKKS